MDALVTWRDGTKNVVSTADIVPVKKGQKFRQGVKVKMLYKLKWYYGTITALEEDSEPDPRQFKKQKTDLEQSTLYNDQRTPVEDSNQDPRHCKKHKTDHKQGTSGHDQRTPVEDSNQDPQQFKQQKTDGKQGTSGHDQRTSDHEMSTSDDEPLSSYKIPHTKNTSYLAPQDIPTPNNYCEYTSCSEPILTTCFSCASFLCLQHFEMMGSCNDHLKSSLFDQNCDTEDVFNTSPEKFKAIASLSSIIEEEFIIHETHEYQRSCDFIMCSEDIFAACDYCKCLLCYDHFKEEWTSCENHLQPDAFAASTTPFNLPEVSSDSQITLTDRLQTCEYLNCNNRVFTTCFQCECFLCILHFHPPADLNYASCSNHFKEMVDQTLNQTLNLPVHGDGETSPSLLRPTQQLSSLAPENFIVEGAPREEERCKPKRKNKFKEAKHLRQSGKEYVSPTTKKVVPARKVGSMCNMEHCAKTGKYCYRFTENERDNVAMDYYSTGNLALQREYIVRFTATKPVKRKTVTADSKRKVTHEFYLPLNGVKEKVCKKMFLNTLGISEKTFRTSVKKVTPTGILAKEKRGGRREHYKEIDARKRDLITTHINRFPRVESHYCRKSSKKEYLHPDLTINKMHSMFLECHEIRVSITLYKQIFKEMNLAFHKPKKDQCSLCNTYREGNAEQKEKLEEKYQAHIGEKEEVRKIKQECKDLAAEEDTTRCASFDLQQVIYLPKSNESAVFYKRRLANFNFTIYDLNSKDCVCNVWNETISKRGSCEISTAVFHFLTNYDRIGTKKVFLFCDGCQGQNKNSVMAGMLLYFIFHCQSIEEISLRFFCPSHGQSEGDSVHSTVSHALDKAGNIYVPSQLVPIIRLARKKPYEAREYTYKDFLDFKGFSQNIKLLQIRKDDQEAAPVKWTDMMEFKVTKADPGKLYFKTSHLEKEFRSISIKRQNDHFFRGNISQLNPTPIKISKEKYDDLVSMCTGETPLIRCQEHVLFYRSLNHE